MFRAIWTKILIRSWGVEIAPRTYKRLICEVTVKLWVLTSGFLNIYGKIRIQEHDLKFPAKTGNLTGCAVRCRCCALENIREQTASWSPRKHTANGSKEKVERRRLNQAKKQPIYLTIFELLMKRCSVLVPESADQLLTANRLRRGGRI